MPGRWYPSWHSNEAKLDRDGAEEGLEAAWETSPEETASLLSQEPSLANSRAPRLPHCAGSGARFKQVTDVSLVDVETK